MMCCLTGHTTTDNEPAFAMALHITIVHKNKIAYQMQVKLHTNSDVQQARDTRLTILEALKR